MTLWTGLFGVTNFINFKNCWWLFSGSLWILHWVNSCFLHLLLSMYRLCGWVSEYLALDWAPYLLLLLRRGTFLSRRFYGYSATADFRFYLLLRALKIRMRYLAAAAKGLCMINLLRGFFVQFWERKIYPWSRSGFIFYADLVSADFSFSHMLWMKWICYFWTFDCYAICNKMENL